MTDNMPAALGRRATTAGIPLLSHTDSTDSLRVGIVLATDKASLPTMKILDRQSPLVNIIKELCIQWKLEDPSGYQMQFDDTKVSPPPIYVTEENRGKMANGDILKLDLSPQRMSKILVEGFINDNLSQENMDRLAVLSADKTFVEQFVTEEGLTGLKKFIVSVARQGRLSPKSGSALAAFSDIMDHSIVSWETMDEKLLSSVLWHLDDQHEPNRLVIKSALTILDCAIVNSSVGKALVVQSKIGVNSFISTVKTRDVQIQVSCVSLINTILEVSSIEKQHQIRKQLLSMPIRQVVWENIFTDIIGAAMTYQLYSLQTRLFNLMSGRLHGAIKPKDPAALKEVEDLRRRAFDDEVDAAGITQQRSRTHDPRDFAKLGFRHPAEPLKEFSEAPPGALALDCMAFFAHQYSQQYRQVVLENSRERADEQDCPFAQASVELTMLLSDILKIGEPPCEPPGKDDRTYCPMFFFKEKPFEECFCVCIQRLTKTWKEMKASLSDFNKVLMVVREQITRALQENPHTFDSLKTKLTNWSFARIQEARQRELERREEEKRQAKPILELREMIKPEIEEVIKQQRINRMIDGFFFKAPRTKGTRAAEKYFYCKLSHNAKVLQYGNCTTEHTPPETLQSLNILEIKDVRESDDAKSRTKAIVITKEGGDELQLTPDLQGDHDVLLDGLYALTDLKPIMSGQAQKELDELLSMEIKLRLLDAEGISFPDEPPPIPAPPANFNFVTA